MHWPQLKATCGDGSPPAGDIATIYVRSLFWALPTISSNPTLALTLNLALALVTLALTLTLTPNP